MEDKKRKAFTTTEQRNEAQKKYRATEKGKEVQKKAVAKSQAKKFIKEMATDDELMELQELIKEKLKK